MRKSTIGVGLGLLLIAVIGLYSGGTAGGPDPTRIFTNPRTAELARAIGSGRETRVEELVLAGANLSDRGQGDVTLLQWAMLRGQPRVVKLLLDLGADPMQRGYGTGTALHMAAQAKNKPYLEILLDHGADPNARDGRLEDSVLSEAIMNRNHEAVKLLLKYRADPNAANRAGETPLHTAALINDYKDMLVLLEAGADLTLRDKAGHTFARYFAITPKEEFMSSEAKSARRAVVEWLAHHGYQE
ncbi:ankyrin repeat domain-containing protein [Aquamicrobium sp.]|uniref:ankyrin repeat domain-containing protein n=1 Tax=Aquamicrobium sp. TaxID=1872579 RepID=UPI002590EB1A|nr:ankyrin repeat domain-containing protein [Aquamicrobium sp.]MCK9549247.1 ankyrin repeat domain-containing protein [Aquamicrobium sp.]